MAGGVEFGALVDLATRVGQLLKDRSETIAIAESSAGGLISAALLAVPGASAYFTGGAIVYTRVAKQESLRLTEVDLDAFRPSTEGHAGILAWAVRDRHASTWGLGETGATGPTGNRYGDAAGHVCLAVTGPADIAITVETGSGDRIANMDAFTRAALELLEKTIRAS